MRTDGIRITQHRPAPGFDAGAQALAKAPGREWSAWLASARRKRRLAREERLEWIELHQRLERRERQSGEYVPDRQRCPYWL